MRETTSCWVWGWTDHLDRIFISSVNLINIVILPSNDFSDDWTDIFFHKGENNQRWKCLRITRIQIRHKIKPGVLCHSDNLYQTWLKLNWAQLKWEKTDFTGSFISHYCFEDSKKSFVIIAFFVPDHHRVQKPWRDMWIFKK